MNITHTAPKPVRRYPGVAIPVVALALAACNPTGGPAGPANTTAGSTAAGTAATTTASAGDAQAAATLFDEAIRADLDGDVWLAEERFIELAHRFPATRHGRTARHRLGGGGGPLVLMGAAGIFAAVGVPAYIKYATRSKSAEANMNLRRVFDSSVAYYSEGTWGSAATAQTAKFPPSVGPTPSRPACLGTLSTPFPPDATLWEHPTWTALNFAVNEPSLYQYEYISEGEGHAAKFTIRATGDLDCDGVFSTFERSGFIDAYGNVTGRDGLVQINELE